MLTVSLLPLVTGRRENVKRLFFKPNEVTVLLLPQLVFQIIGRKLKQCFLSIVIEVTVSLLPKVCLKIKGKKIRSEVLAL